MHETHQEQAQHTWHTYICMKLITGASLTATAITKHSALIRAYLAETAVDKKPMKNLISDHFQSFKRRHCIIVRTLRIVAVWILRRLSTSGVVAQWHRCDNWHTSLTSNCNLIITHTAVYKQPLITTLKNTNLSTLKQKQYTILHYIQCHKCWAIFWYKVIKQNLRLVTNLIGIWVQTRAIFAAVHNQIKTVDKLLTVYYVGWRHNSLLNSNL